MPYSSCLGLSYGVSSTFRSSVSDIEDCSETNKLMLREQDSSTTA